MLVETTLYIIAGVLSIAIAVVLYVFMYRNGDFRPNKLVRTSPIMRGRPSLHVPGIGDCEVTGVEELGENSARIHLSDTYGTKHTQLAYQDEIEAWSVWQQLGGPGNPKWRYIPSKARIIAAIEQEERRNRLRDASIAAKIQAEQSQSEAKMAKVNQNLEVQRTIENLAVMQRANQQQIMRRQ